MNGICSPRGVYTPLRKFRGNRGNGFGFFASGHRAIFLAAKGFGNIARPMGLNRTETREIAEFPAFWRELRDFSRNAPVRRADGAAFGGTAKAAGGDARAPLAREWAPGFHIHNKQIQLSERYIII